MNPVESMGNALQQLHGNMCGVMSGIQNAALVASRAPSVVVMPRHQAVCVQSTSVTGNAPLAMIMPGDGVAEQVISSGVLSFLKLYNGALITRLILTWFPSVPEQIVTPLATVTDPYLNLFRGIIPPLGGTLDLSPILAFVVLNFFTDAAAALPCELAGPSRKPSAPALQAPSWMQPSKFQKAWNNRMNARAAAREARQASEM